MFKPKALIINILIPLITGGFSALLTGTSMTFFNIVKPNFTPPSFVFSIVWTILYILMGISSYIIYTSNSNNKKNALLFYGIQLFLNSFWSIIFFKFKLFLTSTIWIFLIIIFVILMIEKFYKISKFAAKLQIPYLLWLVFAFILNFYTYLIN